MKYELGNAMTRENRLWGIYIHEGRGLDSPVMSRSQKCGNAMF